MVCLRVLARTGRVDCRRPCASFPPSSGSTAMSILCVARWRSARDMIEWMCTQERWNPEVVIVPGAAARYRRATAGSSHDDSHPYTSALHTGAARPPSGFVRSVFFISLRTGRRSDVFEMLPASSYISYFVRKDHELIASYVPNYVATAPNSDLPCSPCVKR